MLRPPRQQLPGLPSIRRPRILTTARSEKLHSCTSTSSWEFQGSGKGTQAQLLAAELDLVHLSVGDVFRWNVEQHTKLGAQVRRIMAAGELVDDALVEAIVRQRLQDHDWNYGFIIDGFPRNVRQAEFFLESYDLDAVILLDLPDEEVAASCSVKADLRRMRARLQRHRSPPGRERDLRDVWRSTGDA